MKTVVTEHRNREAAAHEILFSLDNQRIASLVRKYKISASFVNGSYHINDSLYKIVKALKGEGLLKFKKKR